MKTNNHAGSATGFDLPPLPEFGIDVFRIQGFKAEQMKEYARQAVAVALARATPQQEPAPTLPEVQADEAKLYRDLTGDAMALGFDGVPAALEALRATPQHPRPTDDHLWDETLRDRDANAEWADKLAGAIAIHFGVDIGEHSNMNCPWTEALDAIESAPPPAAADAATPQHSVTEQASMPGDWQVEFDAYSAPGTIRLNSPKWGGCFLGAPKRGDIELPALVYHLLSDMLAQPQASTAATQPEQASIRRWEDRAAEKYPAIPLDKLAPWAKLVAAKAEIRDLRAALAIPASRADGEQTGKEWVDAQNELYCHRMQGAASEQQAGADDLPPLLANVVHVTRRIRRCESDVAAQVVLEHFAMQYAREAVAALTHRATTAPGKDYVLVNGVWHVPLHRATTAADQQGDTASDAAIEAMFKDAGGRWDGNYWVIEDADLHPFIRAVRAQQGAAQAQAGADAARLEWVSHAWGGQRRDYAVHVLQRGGDGDLSDIRTFIDAAMAAPATSKATDE